MPLDASGLTQAIGVAKGQALKIIGGIPILKNFSGSTLEKLKIPKHIDPGNIKGLLSSVQSGGLQSVMQGPLSAAQGQLNTAITSVTSQLSNLPGAGGVLSSLGNLQTSVGNISALASNLSGVSNATTMPDVLDFMGHVGTAQSFGDAIPSALSVDTASAPLNMGPTIQSMSSQVVSTVLDVVQGTVTYEAAAAKFQGFADQVAAADTASRSAISTLQNSAIDLMAVQVVVASQIPGALPESVRTGLRAAIRPDMLGAIDAWVSDRNSSILGPPDPQT